MAEQQFAVKSPTNLSPRIQWLRDYYFQGVKRAWNNEFTAWTTGTPWDFQFNETTFYIVPETYTFFPTFRGAFRQVARNVGLDPGFWTWSITERRAWFVKEVMTKHLPVEILPGDLVAGGRFNIQTSTCMSRKEAAAFDKLVVGKGGTREQVKWFHDHGYGNAGATSGHLIPDYPRILKDGWKGVHRDLEERLAALPKAERTSPKATQLQAMLTSATMARDVAARYAELCRTLIAQSGDRRAGASCWTWRATSRAYPGSRRTASGKRCSHSG
jgi:formate C-acetyltransferase